MRGTISDLIYVSRVTSSFNSKDPQTYNFIECRTDGSWKIEDGGGAINTNRVERGQHSMGKNTKK